MRARFIAEQVARDIKNGTCIETFNNLTQAQGKNLSLVEKKELIKTHPILSDCNFTLLFQHAKKQIESDQKTQNTITPKNCKL